VKTPDPSARRPRCPPEPSARQSMHAVEPAPPPDRRRRRDA
jgi:hypothetical protein